MYFGHDYSRFCNALSCLALPCPCTIKIQIICKNIWYNYIETNCFDINFIIINSIVLLDNRRIFYLFYTLQVVNWFYILKYWMFLTIKLFMHLLFIKYLKTSYDWHVFSMFFWQAQIRPKFFNHFNFLFFPKKIIYSFFS